MLWIAGITAFVSEYLDSSLGMGYGTALTPILILSGYDPLKVVPAVLASQLVTDVVTCISHHRCRNVRFQFDSNDFRIASFLGLISSLGVLAAVVIACKIPGRYLAMYIGTLVLVMGALILRSPRAPVALSWRKIVLISLVAAFNKGLSGGGYGPLVMGGQILSGVNAKNAVGITAFAEAITCAVGLTVYLVMDRAVDWPLAILLLACALPAVPLAAMSVQKIRADRLRVYAGILIALLGGLMLLRSVN